VGHAGCRHLAAEQELIELVLQFLRRLLEAGTVDVQERLRCHH
jgi:hypothetical protein